jgi:hypothetical protein
MAYIGGGLDALLTGESMRENLWFGYLIEFMTWILLVLVLLGVKGLELYLAGLGISLLGLGMWDLYRMKSA